MGSYSPHLRLDERRKRAKWREAKMAMSEFSDRLGRDASLEIFTEIWLLHNGLLASKLGKKASTLPGAIHIACDSARCECPAPASYNSMTDEIEVRMAAAIFASALCSRGAGPATAIANFSPAIVAAMAIAFTSVTFSPFETK